MPPRVAPFALAMMATAALVHAQTAGPAPGESLSQSYRGSQSRNVEYQKIAPFKVMDNVYYVGPGSVSVWLVPTSAGLILIDTAQEPSVDYVVDKIRQVGSDPKNISTSCSRTATSTTSAAPTKSRRCPARASR